MTKAIAKTKTKTTSLLGESSRASVAKGNFKTKLASLQKAGLNASMQVQELLEFAVQHFNTTTTKGSECLYLSALRNTVHKTDGLNVTKFDRYVTDHTNAVKRKNKDGQMIFGLPKDARPEVTTPECGWSQYNPERASTDKPAFDVKDITEYMDKIQKRKKEKCTKEAKCAAMVINSIMRSKEFEEMLKAKVAQFDEVVTEEK